MHTFFKRKEKWREPFLIFQRNPSHGLESWGFFWTIAISFVPVGIIYFTDSPSSVWMELGELPKRLFIKSAIYWDQPGDRCLGWRLAHRPRRRTIMSIAVAGKKRKPRSTDPNISQILCKKLIGMLRLGTKQSLTFAGTNEKEANVVWFEMDNVSVSAGETASQTNSNQPLSPVTARCVSITIIF